MLIKYTGKYVNIYFIMKITFLTSYRKLLLNRVLAKSLE